MKFSQKHPLLSNLILMILLSIIIIGGVFWGLNSYTKHGEKVIVPHLQGLSLEQAEQLLRQEGLRSEVVDCNYFEHLPPGTVYETLPEEGVKVKPGRIIFLTINAQSPRLVQLPSNLEGMSMRQAKATLEGLGFRVVQIRQVPGEFEGLAVGVETTNGKALSPGTKLAANSSLVLLVTGTTAFISDSISALLNEEIPSEGTNTETPEETSEDSWW